LVPILIVLGPGGILCAAAPSGREEPPTADERRADEVKAALAHKLAKFVGWPEPSFEKADSPLRIAVWGDTAFAKLVADAAEGKRVGQRPIQVRLVKKATTLRDCHVVYIRNDDAKAVKELLGTLRDVPILTIGETPGFTTKLGGIVRLFRQETKIRFEINMKAARQAQLEFSSKLLELAAAVYEDKDLHEDE